jgi:hypothetical protein
MGVVCKVGTVDYSVSCEYEESRDSEGKGRGKKGRKEERKREKKKREEKTKLIKWGRERKVEQERAKQIDIYMEWKRRWVIKFKKVKILNKK